MKKTERGCAVLKKKAHAWAADSFNKILQRQGNKSRHPFFA